MAALLTHGKTLAIGGGDIKLMGACGFVLGVWPGLLHSILSLILAVLISKNNRDIKILS